MLAALCGGMVASAGAQQPEAPRPSRKADTPKTHRQAQQQDEPPHPPGGGVRPEPETPVDIELGAVAARYGLEDAHHRHLDLLVGRWRYRAREWMPDVREPRVATGTCVYRWILDGQFLEQEITEIEHSPPAGEARDREAQRPRRALGLLGYEALARRHTYVQATNAAGSVLVGYGPCSEEGRVIELRGRRPAAPGEGRDQQWRAVIRVIDADRHAYEQYAIAADGSEVRELEILFTRDGGGASAPAPEAPRP